MCEICQRVWQCHEYCPNYISVYVEPSKPTDQPEYEPTLKELKDTKKREVGVACNSIIQAGVDVVFPDEHTEHFSLVENELQHDQLNLFGKQVQLASGATQLEYHQDGQPCKYYTAEEMQLIVSTAMAFIRKHILLQNRMFRTMLLLTVQLVILRYSLRTIS